MKKYLLILMGAFAYGCSTPQKQNTKKEAPISEDAALLWAAAQKFFQPIEAFPEKPENKITASKVALGKMLFYDTRLSKTGNNSCNSCHNLSTFGVDNQPTSTGDAGKKGGRNSPTVLNAAFANFQFWDGRAKDVEEQAGMPILNPIEMAIPSKAFLEEKLRATADYPALFAAAFPDDAQPITYQNLQNAIGAFERTLVTPSKFDDFIGKNPSFLNKAELEGLELFINTGCTNCHAGVGIGGTQFQKFGVHGNYTAATGSKAHDFGRQSVTKQASDADVFKVPTLRNIAKTAPYFHDGSVGDLKDAIRIMAKLQLNKDLKPVEIEKIALFLNTLTGEVPKAALMPAKAS